MSQETMIFSRLFQSRDVIHLCHLSTTSFAQHVAMDEYYKGIIELTDSLIEMCQGKHGISEFNVPPSSVMDPIEHLSELAEWIEDNKDSMFTDSYLLNKIDEILGQIYSTLYKLKNLS